MFSRRHYKGLKSIAPALDNSWGPIDSCLPTWIELFSQSEAAAVFGANHKFSILRFPTDAMRRSLAAR